MLRIYRGNSMTREIIQNLENGIAGPDRDLEQGVEFYTELLAGLRE